RFNCSNHYLMRKWAGDQPEPWFWEAEAGAGDLADVRFLLGANRDNTLLIQLYNQGYPTYIKQLGDVGHVNRHGLTIAGEAFIIEMMDRGMLIDVEHLLSRALDLTLAIAKSRDYPLVSSHTGFRALAVPRATGPGAPLYVRGCA